MSTIYKVSDKNNKIVKIATTREQAEKMRKQLTAVFDTPFIIRTYADVWQMNDNK